MMQSDDGDDDDALTVDWMIVGSDWRTYCLFGFTNNLALIRRSSPSLLNSDHD